MSSRTSLRPRTSSRTPPLACISTGYFPTVLKTAEVVPIFKKGERELCSNYRPISILNPFAKLFEKCLLDQLNKYFVSNNLISPDQYGFKKNCSTNEAVLDIYNKLLYLTIWIKSSFPDSQMIWPRSEFVLASSGIH